MTKYISVTETAKIIRNELKKGFPGIKFSVRSKSYAGGASIRIEYTDGPAYEKVNSLVQKFAGATFDGMIDLKEYKDDTYHEGERVSWGADFVFVDRNPSNETFTSICNAISEKFGTPAPVFSGGENGRGMWVSRNEQNPIYPSHSLHTAFHREFGKWDASDGLVNGSDDLPSVKQYKKENDEYEATIKHQVAIKKQNDKMPEPVRAVMSPNKAGSWKVW